MRRVMPPPEVDTSLEFGEWDLGRPMRPFVADVLSYDATWLLDVCCGTGETSRALLGEARARGRRLEIVALDPGDEALSVAQARSGAEPFLRFVRADPRHLPFPDGCFDIATCHVALHRFDGDAAVDILRELRRVTRLTPIVCDLERTRVAAFAAAAVVRFGGGSRPTLYDAALAIKRSYTMAELEEFATLAGWSAPNLRRSGLFRIIMRDGA